MDTDGGYAYKVLSQKARIQAAAQGKPIPANPIVNLPILAASGQMQKAVQNSEAGQVSVVADVLAEEASKPAEAVAADKATDI
jgi:hypothetical protein